ncbi:MAG: RsmE family RNA methyltransferase [Spirochaetaceae bacterium]|nr:RsmE family RNA methyltransferase [Spirochaetaceae bacterium]
MNIVLFKESEISQRLSLKDPRGEHIKKILHKSVGDTFEAGIINVSEGECRILEITEKDLAFEYKPLRPVVPLYNIKLVIGFPRPIQLKRLLRDVVSLGVSEIHLTGTELGEKSYLKSTLLEKGAAEAALIDGACQAKSAALPLLYMHNNLSECLDLIFKDVQPDDELVLLDNIKPEFRLSDAVMQRQFEKKTVIAAIGSERGWTDRERDKFKERGFKFYSLGKRVLRTETAATTAVSLALAAMNIL